MSIDLGSGRIPIDTKIKLPLTWGMDIDKPWGLPVSTMFTKKQQLALDAFQGFSSGKSITESALEISRD
ncbi:hypothetical protein E8K88_12900 [Lampropedia aestuarii]|uniref:Uncharacterized protein n=1 Tax=Lampropedia aestuarii TaxID=2562762 RepID=A0A4S5BIA5_9BURK|nr:hypothetical protein [Lampropedia aestuarii]THJ32144.1 hypothetical protein E8K88_12900 [Lampropedia aestuarii]